MALCEDPHLVTPASSRKIPGAEGESVQLGAVLGYVSFFTAFQTCLLAIVLLQSSLSSIPYLGSLHQQTPQAALRHRAHLTQQDLQRPS